MVSASEYVIEIIEAMNIIINVRVNVKPHVGHLRYITSIEIKNPIMLNNIKLLDKGAISRNLFTSFL